MRTGIRIGVAVLSLMTMCAHLTAQRPIDIERGLNNISPDSTVIVGLDSDGKLAVFQKEGIANVSTNRLTLKKDAFALLSVELMPAPEDVMASIAVRTALMNLWQQWKKEHPAKEEFTEKRDINGVAYVLTGRAVAAKEPLVFQLRDILQSGLPRR
jgi:hypothetical protein